MLRIAGQLERLSRLDVESVRLAIVACGFEARSRWFAETFDFRNARRIATRFPDQRTHSYALNAEVMTERGYSLVDVDNHEFVEWVCGEIGKVPGKDRLCVFVDVSSQTRTRTAAIVEALAKAGRRRPLRVLFGYVIAKFTESPRVAAPNVGIGPVSPFYAGWTTDPDLPVSLIVGLGYETDRALGAVEYLEPASVWALLPRSRIRKYDIALRGANDQLLRQVGAGQVITYNVEDVNATLSLLSALVSHLSQRSSVLLLPSGPKILVLVALLLACERNDVAVWRISAGANDPAVDRHAKPPGLIVECAFDPEPIGIADAALPSQLGSSTRFTG